MSGRHFIVTCEHGGNDVPARYAKLFVGAEELLASHRGHDPGAAEMGRDLATALEAPFYCATTSRLLVDLNRSPGHPALFSERTRGLSRGERGDILDQYYVPYRTAVDKAVAEHSRAACVVHLSSHSFVPALAGKVRNADIGLLYDPRRAAEADFCAAWRAALNERLPGLRVRRNYPYAGSADGFTTYLRRRYDGDRYLGVELEINQRFPLGLATDWQAVRASVVAALLDLVDSAAAPASARPQPPPHPGEC